MREVGPSHVPQVAPPRGIVRPMKKRATCRSLASQCAVWAPGRHDGPSSPGGQHPSNVAAPL